MPYTSKGGARGDANAKKKSNARIARDLGNTRCRCGQPAAVTLKLTVENPRTGEEETKWVPFCRDHLADHFEPPAQPRRKPRNKGGQSVMEYYGIKERQRRPKMKVPFEPEPLPTKRHRGVRVFA